MEQDSEMAWGLKMERRLEMELGQVSDSLLLGKRATLVTQTFDSKRQRCTRGLLEVRRRYLLLELQLISNQR